MQKFTAACLAVMTLSALLLVGCSVGLNNSGDGKHTGPVTVRSTGGGYFYTSNPDDYSAHFEFIRPNKEVFEMTFAPGTRVPKFGVGDQLSDLVYVDASKGSAVFVKAVLDKEYVPPPPPPPIDLTLYTSAVASSMCSSNGGCTISQGEPKAFYLWNDGAYRSKPDPKSKCKGK